MPSWPPGGGKALLAPPPPGSAPDYLGEQYFVGRGGGQGPLGPPPGSAPVFRWFFWLAALSRGGSRNSLGGGFWARILRRGVGG